MGDYFANWDQNHSWQSQLENDPESVAYRNRAAQGQAGQGGIGNYNDPTYNQDRNQDSVWSGANTDNQLNFYTRYISPELRGEDSAYKPNSLGFQYGGQYGGARDAVGTAYSFARDADQRGAYRMDPTQQNQARGYQGIAAGSYIDTLRGRNPSVAQQQLRQGLGQAVGQAGGMAASARGGGANLASAQRNAMRTQADLSSNYNNQAAQLRAQEIAQAQAGLAGVGGQMRGQDQGWQGAQAGLEMQQRGLNDARNMNYWNSAQQINRDQLGANMAQEQMRYQADRDQRQQNYDVQKSNVGRSQQRADGIIDSFGKMLSFGSDERIKKDVSNDNPYGPLDYSGGIFRPASQPTATSTAPGVVNSPTANSSVLDQYRSYKKMLAEDDKPQAKQDATAYASSKDMASGIGGLAGMFSGGGGGGGGGLGSMFSFGSDKRMKKDVLDAADAMEPKSYRYKWEPESEPKRIGIMAQDLEKSPLGKQVVLDTPQGKQIDVNRGISLALASVAALKDELNTIKGGKRGR